MEKKVTYSKFFIALTCLFASNLFAFEIITSEEDSALQEIQNKYDIDSQLISANNKLSSYNKGQYDYKSLATSIDNDKASYEQLIEALPEKVVSGENVADYFKDIETLLLNIDRSQKEYIAAGIALKEEYQMIEIDYDKINDARTEKSNLLAALKQKIVTRLVTDLSKPDSAQHFQFQGTAVCSKFQSISDCLNENEQIIISKTKKSEPFLNDHSVLLSYEVHDASMNMSGELNYSVSMSFRPSYDQRVESLLNERFGLKSAMITLKSNVAADWFIDGILVGQGKKIQHEVTLGRHGILASYESHGQSSIEVIEGNGQFVYMFENNIVPLMPQKIVAPKALPESKVKSMDTPKANSDVKKPMPKPAVKEATKLPAVNENKDYLYFMGIEPESQQQQESFSK